MKLIGLLGGMSWESTQLYYRIMNETVRKELGGNHSARILLHSVDFHDFEQLQHKGDWTGIGRRLGEAAHGLKAGGADFLVIATNTMHKVHDEIARISGLDVLHIADPTGEALRRKGHRRVALLGTRYTMEHDFYRNRLRDHFGLSVMTPDDDHRLEVHRIIYQELCHGVIREESRRLYKDVIARFEARGAEAIILGCTEITMIIGQDGEKLPIYDTTRLHAEAAVRRAMVSVR